ncbi:27063_t:CDS:2 [Gigaspora margarita]|uniref:27063_t:CDS:1 n=1 Tax=Gigaspora margarita TaxID=4874 RepID=A0ABN7UJZ2_GIGMA|nr:27063_t:CDS:2 [Gigaspora margarita]
MATNTQEILIFFAMCESMLQELEEGEINDRIILQTYGILFNKISRPKANGFWNKLIVPFKNPELNLDSKYKTK